MMRPRRSELDGQLGRDERGAAMALDRSPPLDVGPLVVELGRGIPAQAIAERHLETGDVRIPRVCGAGGIRDVAEAQRIPAAGRVRAERERILELEVSAIDAEVADGR